MLAEQVAAKEALMDCTGERQTPNVTEVQGDDDDEGILHFSSGVKLLPNVTSSSDSSQNHD